MSTVRVRKVEVGINSEGKVVVDFYAAVIDESDVRPVRFSWGLWRHRIPENPNPDFRLALLDGQGRPMASLPAGKVSIQVVEALLKHGGAYGKVHYSEEGSRYEGTGPIPAGLGPGLGNDTPHVIVISEHEWTPFNSESITGLEKALGILKSQLR